jgi:hypothetical protein
MGSRVTAALAGFGGIQPHGSHRRKPTQTRDRKLPRPERHAFSARKAQGEGHLSPIALRITYTASVTTCTFKLEVDFSSRLQLYVSVEERDSC